MSDVSVEIRVFPEKEMLSVDMAEVLDAAVFNNGVLQGCEVTLSDGALTMASGRIIVGGRLGVVTGGTIPLPTLVAKETCWVVGVCDLSAETPFYINVVNADGFAALETAKAKNNTFNVTNGLDFMTFGSCKVDPATNKASEWATMAQGTAKKGWDFYSGLIERIDTLNTNLTNAINNKMTWKLVRDTDIKAGTWVTLPDTAKEVCVSVFISWTNARKVAVDIIVPASDYLFNLGTNQTQTYHVNHWGQTSDGYICIATMRDSIPHKYVKIQEAWAGNTDVTSSTYCRIFYR